MRFCRPGLVAPAIVLAGLVAIAGDPRRIMLSNEWVSLSEDRAYLSSQGADPDGREVWVLREDISGFAAYREKDTWRFVVTMRNGQNWMLEKDAWLALRRDLSGR